MKTAAAILLTLTVASPAIADAIEEVRQAEIGFAKAFADRDKAKFFSYVADDAVFMGPMHTQRGKQQVIERWSRYFDNVPVAPFRWGPERVEVTAGGKIGFSMGPIYDAAGNHAGYYSSVWQKQGDGTWKVVIDGPGSPPAPLPETAAKLEEGHVTTPDGVKLYYRKLSAGSPLTIIAPLDSVLHDSLKQFADVATIITYDPRNRGRSTRSADAGTWTSRQDVADLETIRAHFKVEKFIPVGDSDAGKVVALYAAQHPERVTRLIQLGPAALSAEELKKIAMPVLVIDGDGGRAWAASLPDARLVSVPGAAHAFWRDDPVAVFGAIRHFLRSEWPLGSTIEN